MNDIAGKRCTGALVALGTNVRMSPNRIQRRIKMLNAGNGLAPMALSTGEIGPDPVDILCLFNVAEFATQHLIKLDALVRVG